MSPFYHDLLERTVVTFFEGFITVLIALPFLANVVEEGVFDVAAGQRVVISALAGGVMSALAAAKAVLARKVADPNTASLVDLSS